MTEAEVRNITGIVILIALSAIAVQTQSQKNSVDQLQQSVAEAYRTKTMRTLDGRKLSQGSLLVVIEHSLIDGKGQYVRRRFKTFAQMDNWLKKQEREDGTPFRQLKPLQKCVKGRCAYNFDNGILHNQLYLHDLYYAFRSGRPYVLKLHLLDGD